MDGYVVIAKYLTIYAELGALAVLGLQVAAYRHHRHPSLLVLIISSVIGMAYGALASLPYFMTHPWFQGTPFALACAALATPATAISIVGVALLFRSYRQLVDGNTKAQARIRELESRLPCPALPASHGTDARDDAYTPLDKR